LSSTPGTSWGDVEARQLVQPRRDALGPSELAWIAAVPCALLTVAAIVLLGPPLARVLPVSRAADFWPSAGLAPEPVEHARYALALLGPLLLAAVVAVACSRPVRMRRDIARGLTAASRALACGLLALALLAQNGVLLHANAPPSRPDRLFNGRTLTVAAAFALLALALLRLRPVGERIVRTARDPRAVRVACLALAAVLTATWLSAAIDSDATIGRSSIANLIPWDMNETFAVLDGRTPLANFHAQYSQLWPYLAAGALALLGASMTVWTIAMTALSGIALLAVYATFRRIVRRSLLALALYLPFLAIGFFFIGDPFKSSLAGVFSAWPMRYAGPYLLAWLTARHLDGVAPRRPRLLLVAAGLVAINNPEFGLGALAGTVLALACRTPPSSLRHAIQLLGDVAVGLLGAALLVAGLTLVRAGSLPHFGYVLEFPRIYGVGGWVLEPMKPLGFHIAMYATFCASLVAGVARAARRAEQPVLTSMLAWSGAFGLIAGSYYVGRSDILNLASLFSAWCFAVALLVVAVVQRLAAASGRRPSLAELAVLFGFGLAICALPDMPTPWSQAARLRDRTTPRFEQPALTAFVAHATRPGERVLILAPLSHRVAYDLGLENVAPYSSPESMPTKRQTRTMIEALRSERVHAAFLAPEAGPEQLQALRRVGFVVARRRRGFSELTATPSR
jgi:hypothetical protein